MVRTMSILMVMQIVFLLGLFSTGSRLGFLIWSLVNAIIVWRIVKNKPVYALPIGLFLFSLIVTVITFYAEDFGLIGRLVGIGDENYETGLDGRVERQSKIIELGLKLITGVGAGNVGYALGLNEIGQNFYGAHGFVYQYTASLGVFGTILYLSIFFL